ncbi:MAG: hypothetical protein KDD53_09675, partial [Bdellovibrionales bacterium]|nr:hypothetical protein [Bdellovibrionales bacterium]
KGNGTVDLVFMRSDTERTVPESGQTRELIKVSTSPDFPGLITDAQPLVVSRVASFNPEKLPAQPEQAETAQSTISESDQPKLSALLHESPIGFDDFLSLLKKLGVSHIYDRAKGSHSFLQRNGNGCAVSKNVRNGVVRLFPAIIKSTLSSLGIKETEFITRLKSR